MPHRVGEMLLSGVYQFRDSHQIQFPSAVLLTKDDGKEIALNSWKINFSQLFPGIQGTGLFK